MTFGGIFDYDRRKVRIVELEERTQDPEFWQDPVEAKKVMRSLDGEKDLIESWDSLSNQKESIQLFFEFLSEGEDVEEDLTKEIDSF